MIKLSIIVPVYNVAAYLCKCVNSLIHQNFSDYEIVLIDDGSTDGSGKICDELSETIRDERLAIMVIHQENGGLSAARNAGLKVAQGEHVCFVDSDDYWEENVLGGLMEQVEKEHLDVLRFDYQNVRKVNSEELGVNSEGEYEVFEPNKTPRYIDKRNEVVDGETYLNTRMGYACYAWQFVVRKDIVDTFTPGLHFEDVDWLPRMMLRAKRVNSTTKIVYDYFLRPGSITKTQGDKTKILKNVEDRIIIIERYNHYIELYPNCRWLKNMQSSMVAGVLTTIAREYYDERKAYIKRLNEMKVFPLSIADQGKTYARRAKLINLISPNLYCLIMHLKK